MDKKSSSESNSLESLVEMNRLNNLSDGVFAIALTLLAFGIRVPEGLAIGDLPKKLLDLAPQLTVFLISFVVIGGAWGSHQRMLNQIKRGDGLLVWINLFCLLFVALLPASAALLGGYPNAFLAITCFALNVAMIQLATLWLWRHAGRHRLINPTLDPRVVKSIGRRLSLSTVIFLLTIPLALWSTWIIYLFWVGLFILIFTTDWLSWQQAIKTQHASIPLEGARRARVGVKHWGGHLNISANVTTQDLLQGVFGGGLDRRINRTEEVLDVQLGIKSGPAFHGFLNPRFPWTWGLADLLDWTIRLSQQIPMVLDIESASGQATLELTALHITELHIKTASNLVLISLPSSAAQTLVNIQGSSTYLTIRVPLEAGAHITANRGLTGAKIDLARFQIKDQAGEYWSANYEIAANRIDIHLDVFDSFVVID
jgi:uncharacterized membrane protein